MQEMPFQRPKFQNGISNQYILCKSALKMQEMHFRDPNFKTFPGGYAPGPPYNCVVTMASPSLNIRKHIKINIIGEKSVWGWGAIAHPSPRVPRPLIH